MFESPPPPPSPSPSPTAIDQDAALANSTVLSRSEVIARRLRRVKQLARCYRGHYWALMEDLKFKYRDYYWTYGKSPFKDEDENHPDGTVVSGDVVRCAFGGCKSKAMALSRFCHAHILSDPKQQLYAGCTTVAKNLPTGPSFCNKPVLRSVVPRACHNHYQYGEKCLIGAVRRAGYRKPISGKPSAKLHVVIPEFVRQIQNKRNAARKAHIPKPESK